MVVLPESKARSAMAVFDFRRNLRLLSENFVEVQFYNGIPDRKERLIVTPTQRPVSRSKGVISTSRPTSRNKSKSPHYVSQPTSARSAKSSPIPPALPDTPPVPSRHRNKGLETSSAMMELFGGGGGSAFGAGSVFDPISRPKDFGSFHRKNILEKELHQLSEWEAVKYPPVKAPFFSEIEDHTMAYDRARKRGNWRSTSSQFDQVAQPGPEWFEDSNNPNMEQQVEPAATTDISCVRTETPNLGDDWKEAKEDVLETPTLSEEEKQRMLASEPGPDLGDDEVLEHCRILGVHARILPENRTIVPYLERKMLDLGITGPEGFYQSRPEEVSSAESLSALERARSTGALAHAEIASAAVAADGTHYFNKCLKHASIHMTEVPLRVEGSSRIVSALASQPLAVCTSGHHAISSESRLCAKDFTSMPKGTVGVEERMCVVWEKAVRTGRIDPMRFVAVTSTNAAKMFNMYPKKGRIAVGADADLVLWDASVRWKLSSSERQSSVDTSLYDGLTIHAQAAVTIVGGQIAWRDGKIQEAKGSFVQLAANSPYLFSVVQQRDKISTAEKVDRGDSAAPNGMLPKRNNQEPLHDRPTPMRKSHLESNISFG
ncbi:amidohydrolase family protein [Necator americanus]|uniref:Amidohydrolase family protein n=1 Tax=Necator americanus TaxID=51031 RepID=W2SZA4_NECAM|nr:amidohydrolase family protein [Necator americanus]ETN74281.1 amidohydrolase family protein [Necator americanus]